MGTYSEFKKVTNSNIKNGGMWFLEVQFDNRNFWYYVDEYPCKSDAENALKKLIKEMEKKDD